MRHVLALGLAVVLADPAAAAPPLRWVGTVTTDRGTGRVTVTGRQIDANTVRARWRCRGGCPVRAARMFINCSFGGPSGVLRVAGRQRCSFVTGSGGICEGPSDLTTRVTCTRDSGRLRLEYVR